MQIDRLQIDTDPPLTLLHLMCALACSSSPACLALTAAVLYCFCLSNSTSLLGALTFASVCKNTNPINLYFPLKKVPGSTFRTHYTLISSSDVNVDILMIKSRREHSAFTNSPARDSGIRSSWGEVMQDGPSLLADCSRGRVTVSTETGEVSAEDTFTSWGRGRNNE